jgi:iron complex outermembrane receptor protein
LTATPIDAHLPKVEGIEQGLMLEMLFEGLSNSLRGCAWAAVMGSLLAMSSGAEAALDLSDMSIEDLAQIEVTSVSKRAEPLGDAPAAIYVITHDDIIRSGATALPEMLRLAPNLQVAQVTASRYDVSARGFNGGAADKLLVLVDGRSIYTPFSSGVNWDLQEVPADNIERIEVVSGPGGTLWGANAVNGVINIITRKSSDTQGLTAELGGGNTEIRGRLQYGGKISDDLSYRAYVGGFEHWDKDVTGTGAKARDGWNKVQGGFRVDWEPAADLITVQGDLYDGSEQQLRTVDEDISGRNLLARWTHAMGGGSSLQVQAYYDHIDVSVPNNFANHLDTYDIQAQHNFSLGDHQIVWGGGYRVLSDDFPTVLSAGQGVQFIPQSRTFKLWNLFLQDSFSLTGRLKLIAGIKIEDEPYTGVELMPNARLAWAITDTSLLWLAASRAVRVPSRLDRDVTQHTGSLLTITGGTMQPVKVAAYELGYRAQPLTDLSFSISAFYNVYPNLRSAEPTNGNFPLTFENGMEGKTYGVEFWANYRVADWWRLTAGANWLHKDLRFKPGNLGVGGLQIAGNDPKYQLSLRSAMDLGRNVTLNLDLRRIGALPAPPSPAYVELNARIAWAVSDKLELSLTGSNLLHAYHTEFGTIANTLQVGPVGVRIRRSVFVATRWKF